MRVLYLHQYFVPPNTPGGTRSYEFARRLVRSGHEVTLVTSSAMMPHVPSTGPIVRERLDGIDLVILPIAYDNTMTYGERIRAFVHFATWASGIAARTRCDVVFATSTPLTIAIPGLVARAFTGAPMVFEVRDLWPELPIAMGALRSPWSRMAARGLEFAAYHGASHVVALSPGMADGIARRGIPRERITVIPNACDLDLFDADPTDVATFRAECFPMLAPAQPLIVYAGTFGPINDARWLVELAGVMRDIDPSIRFAMVGSGAQTHAIAERARELGVLDHNLWMRSPIAKRRMPLLLRAATVTTSLFAPVPEMENNSANKFFDGLAAGRPIAINYRGWQAALLDRSGAGIVLPHDDLGTAAIRLANFCTDPERLERSGLAAARLAREEFDRDTLATRLERVLIDVVRRHAAA